RLARLVRLVWSGKLLALVQCTDPAHPTWCCAIPTLAHSRSTTSPIIRSGGAALLGTVGMDWHLGGFAAGPSTASIGSSSQVAQLVQAMAGFGGSSGAADGLDTAPLGAETSQQALLATPQHA